MPLPSHLSTVEICPACNAEWKTDADRYRQALERLADALGDVRVSGLAARTYALHEAWTDAKAVLG